MKLSEVNYCKYLNYWGKELLHWPFLKTLTLKLAKHHQFIYFRYFEVKHFVGTPLGTQRDHGCSKKVYISIYFNLSIFYSTWGVLNSVIM